ncbi:hypothetical protein [Teredinibacter purpureus]|uniref:hypothetical protein n=1 Tax=Teredinibacter purpureus TaxID=2731756 RepID=UPI0005F7F21E|nr:hypothetical protein [Teredinibacter purpureus]
MLFNYIEKQWKAGNVRAGLPAVGHGDTIYLEGKGLFVTLALLFLSDFERTKISALSKAEAIEKVRLNT